MLYWGSVILFYDYIFSKPHKPWIDMQQFPQAHNAHDHDLFNDMETVPVVR